MFKKFPKIAIEAQEKGEEKLEKKAKAAKSPKRKAMIEKKLAKMEKGEGKGHEAGEKKYGIKEEKGEKETDQDGKGGCK